MSTDFGKFFTNFQKNFAAVFLTFGAARARAYCTRSYAASRLFKGDKRPFTARFLPHVFIFTNIGFYYAVVFTHP